MRHPAIKAPTGRQPPALQPGQARRYLEVLRNEDAARAIARARAMAWGRSIVGRPVNCARPGRASVWVFTVEAGAA